MADPAPLSQDNIVMRVDLRELCVCVCGGPGGIALEDTIKMRGLSQPWENF